jgi:hypothetical protein
MRLVEDIIRGFEDALDRRNATDTIANLIRKLIEVDHSFKDVMIDIAIRPELGAKSMRAWGEDTLIMLDSHPEAMKKAIKSSDSSVTEEQLRKDAHWALEERVKETHLKKLLRDMGIIDSVKLK